jgi:hypothetical protein
VRGATRSSRARGRPGSPTTPQSTTTRPSRSSSCSSSSTSVTGGSGSSPGASRSTPPSPTPFAASSSAFGWKATMRSSTHAEARRRRPSLGRSTSDELCQARETVPAKLRRALDALIDRVADLHRRQLPHEWQEERDGIRFGELARPLRSVGCYVPGGRGPHPAGKRSSSSPRLTHRLSSARARIDTPRGVVAIDWRTRGTCCISIWRFRRPVTRTSGFQRGPLGCASPAMAARSGTETPPSMLARGPSHPARACSCASVWVVVVTAPPSRFPRARPHPDFGSDPRTRTPSEGQG